MGEEERFGKCKESGSRIQKETQYKSKKIREVRLSGRTRLQERGVTGKVYYKNVVEIG